MSALSRYGWHNSFSFEASSIAILPTEYIAEWLFRRECGGESGGPLMMAYGSNILGDDVCCFLFQVVCPSALRHCTFVSPHCCEVIFHLCCLVGG